MDFNTFLIEFLTSLIIVVRRLVLLVFQPYKTIRKISRETDWQQLMIIFLLVFGYFLWSGRIRPRPVSPFFVFLLFLVNLSVTIGFFYFLSLFLAKTSLLSSFIFTFSYSLFPTLIWFAVNSLLYVFLPPPRQMTFLGKGFSIVFIAFSASLLAWKLILVYLSIRFSSKMNFYQIVYSLILYLCFFLPYSVLLYQLRLFRIPFI